MLVEGPQPEENMTYNPDIHHRRSIRLKEFDYSSPNAYFVTISVQERECLFGKIVDGKLWANDSGAMVSEWWIKLPEKFPGVTLDEFVVMPNHLHGIIAFVGADPCVCPGLKPHASARFFRSRVPLRIFGPIYNQGRTHGYAPTKNTLCYHRFEGQVNAPIQKAL